jgi:RND family efflux transporter MFP subunit
MKTRTPSITHPLILFIALALAGCGGEEKTPSAATRHTVQAQVSTIQPTETITTMPTPGTVVAEDSVQVASRLMGYIKNIAVVEGQSVKAGQRLFTIDPMDIQGAVEQARLGLKQAEDALADAKADFDRFAALYKDDVVTRQQYEKMRLNYEIARSRAAQAESGLTTAQGQLKYAVVTSPIDGVVTRKLATEGDIAAPGHPVLMVENPARLQVQTSVPDTVFNTLRLGQSVQVQVDGLDRDLTAKIARLSPAADPVSHTYLVKLDVAAPGLKSGAFARVLFPAGKTLMLAVPQAAVLDRAGITGVFVVDDKGVAEYRMVRTGSTADGRVEILSGLNPGERVVTGNAESLDNGDQVVSTSSNVTDAQPKPQE